MHAGALCVISRDAFVPTLFAVGAQQPLHLTPAFEAIAKITPYTLFMPRDLGRLSDAGPGDPLNPFSPKLLENYDFVLVFNEELFPFRVPEPFHLVESDDPVKLFGRAAAPE